MIEQTVAGDTTACRTSELITKRSLKYDKIMILTIFFEKRGGLATCLRKLFPASDIEMQSRMEFTEMLRGLHVGYGGLEIS